MGRQLGGHCRHVAAAQASAQRANRPWSVARGRALCELAGPMGIEKTTRQRLRDSERAELDEILREFAGQKMQFTARFCSNEGDTLAWFLLLGLAGLGGIVAGIVEGVPSLFVQYYRYDFAAGTLGLLRNPVTLGFGAAVIAVVWSASTFLRTHRRCGWAVTSYGVMRVFGDRLTLLRFADVASGSRRRVGTRRPFSVLELTAKNGQRLVTYATPLMDTILARLPA
jgi:hypothetical protein